MEKQFSKRIQKTMREEARKMREEKRVKSGFYPKLTTALLILLLVLFSFLSYNLNKKYSELIVEAQNISNNAEKGQILTNSALVEPTTARVTCYAPTGEKTASGKVPKNGMVAVSDRTIPFGTEIVIDGNTYIVEDFTNKRIQEQFGMLTVDIFMEEGCDLSYGAKEKLVFIK